MTKEFAKLFWVDGIGQILVKMDTDDEDGSPEVRFYVKPEGLGVCSMAIGFTDDGGGYLRAEQLFERIDAEMADGLVRKSILDVVGGDE